MSVVLVAAVARHRVIGAQQGIPWHIPGEQRRFKTITMGHALVMGRKTFESIGRVLPGRRTIVITRDGQWSHPGVETADSLTSALALARAGAQAGNDAGRDVMVVGGGQIYAEALPLADRLEITHIDLDVAGDTFFPEIDDQQWEPEITEDHGSFSYVTYVRRTA